MIAIENTFASLEKTQKYELTNAQLQKENTEARFEVLKQQVNPHFLFNALSTLRHMVRSGDANTEKFILNLSDVYRNLLTNNQGIVTIQSEIKFLNQYFFMIKSRFENMVDLTVTLNEPIMNASVPSLSLQLLVENCVKHNIISSTKKLHISILQKEPGTITVQNNLQLKSKNEESSGIGLLNLKKRYELLHIENGIKIVQTPEFFSVTLKLLG